MTITDVMSAWDAIRSLGADPAVASFVSAVIVPVALAALDQPWWTPTRRRALVLAVAVALSFLIWLVSAYPWAWEIIATQTSVICGITWIVYSALATIRVGDVRLIDWVGILTPGGETRADYQARHRAVSPEVEAPAGDTGEPDHLSWPPLGGGEGRGVGR